MGVIKDNYLKWFKSTNFKNIQIDLGVHGFIPNAQIMVDSHVKVLNYHWGKRRYRPFITRLELLKIEFLNKKI